MVSRGVLRVVEKNDLHMQNAKGKGSNTRSCMYDKQVICLDRDRFDGKERETNGRAIAQTDTETNYEANARTGRQDRHTDRQTDRQTNRQTGRQADMQTGQTRRQADRQTDT